MKNIFAAGTCCTPQLGSAVVPGPAWPASRGRLTETPAAAGNPHLATFGGRVVYRTRFRRLINPDGFAMPVTHRMRMSASEP